MRDMLENVGVRRLGPAEASLLLGKRLLGDHQALLSNLSAVGSYHTTASSRGTENVSRATDPEEMQEGSEDVGMSPPEVHADTAEAPSEQQTSATFAS